MGIEGICMESPPLTSGNCADARAGVDAVPGP